MKTFVGASGKPLLDMVQPYTRGPANLGNGSHGLLEDGILQDLEHGGKWTLSVFVIVGGKWFCNFCFVCFFSGVVSSTPGKRCQGRCNIYDT